MIPAAFPLALSIRQPWAWLIVNGFKPIENRDYRTNYRRPFFVHAAKTMTLDDHEACLLFLRSIGLLGRMIEGRRLIVPAYTELERGGIVGSARVTGCVDRSDSPWFTGKYGYELADAKPLPFVACNGMPGFFRLPEHLKLKL